MEYVFKLTKQQLDTVMKALGELPFKESCAVFNEINNQYLAQTEGGANVQEKQSDDN